MMGVALYMEHVMQLEPCNLCILQRVAVIFTGLIALIAAIHGANTSGIKIYGYLIVLTSLVGSGLSARQLWLQSLPADQVPACGASLDYLLDVFSLGEVLSMVLSGDGECAKVVWSFLGLSIPGWLLIAFLGLITIGFFQVLRAKR
jgi:disulfide bond formation protein DsbB